MLTSANADWPGNPHYETVSRTPGDTHMQSPIAAMLLRHRILRCQWHARPKAGAAPVEIGMLRHRLREARLADCFSQKHFDSLIQFAEEYRFSLGGERRRNVGVESLP